MRLLLLDTCSENASLALAEDENVLRSRMLLRQTASAPLIGAVRDELEALEWPLLSLDAVGVVHGPGSFTGVRVGLAAAKGLCEVAGLPLAVVSRLAVMLDAGGAHANDVAVLDAGRDEFYIRSGETETLLTRADLARAIEHAGAGRVLVAEAKLVESLGQLNPFWVELSAARALRLVQERLNAGGDPIDIADANYVRSARALYSAGRRSPSTENEA